MENVTIDRILTNASITGVKECYGTYASVVLAFLFFVSEVLPFIKKKVCPEDEGSAEQGEKTDSCLSESNGILELAVNVLTKNKVPLAKKENASNI